MKTSKVWVPLKYFGGKRRLVNTILNYFPVNYHKMIYVEMFGGSGVVLTTKNKSLSETYNDVNGELCNFFEILRTRTDDFIKQLMFVVDSRPHYLKYTREEGNGDVRNLDDLERAFRFFYVNRYSFSSLTKGWHGSYGITKYQQKLTNQYDLQEPVNKKTYLYFNRQDFFSHVYSFVDRWQGVAIRNHDFRELFKLTDTENTFYYLDPPYFRGGAEYSIMYGMPYEMQEWCEKDYEDLRDICKKLEGKFLISIDDCEESRKMFQGWNAYSFDVVYSCGQREGGSKKRRARELLIYNYDAITGEKL